MNSQQQQQQRVAFGGQAVSRLLNFINEVGQFNVSFLICAQVYVARPDK
jgi:hypothetical protein